MFIYAVVILKHNKIILIMKNILIYLTFFLMSCGIAQAQKITLESGSLDIMKSEKLFNIAYDYSEVSVGKFTSEDDYINKKVTDYNAKEPGKGDQWKESWLSDRDARYKVSFEELFNKYIGKKDISISDENTDAKYTFVLKTTFIEPGYNIHISRRPAMINVIFKLVETANPSNVLFELKSLKNPGNSFGGYDYDTGVRIQEAYAKCGKELANYLLKKALK